MIFCVHFFSIHPIEEKVKKFNDTLYNEEKPYNLYYGVEIVNEYETLEAVLEEVKKIYAALDCGDRVYLIE